MLDGDGVVLPVEDIDADRRRPLLITCQRFIAAGRPADRDGLSGRPSRPIDRHSTRARPPDRPAPPGSPASSATGAHAAGPTPARRSDRRHPARPEPRPTAACSSRQTGRPSSSGDESPRRRAPGEPSPSAVGAICTTGSPTGPATAAQEQLSRLAYAPAADATEAQSSSSATGRWSSSPPPMTPTADATGQTIDRPGKIAAVGRPVSRQGRLRAPLRVPVARGILAYESTAN